MTEPRRTWMGLTDGNEWRIHNSHAKVPVEQGLFRGPGATATRNTPTLRLGRVALACQADRRIEGNVMARKKDKKAQKDKKTQSAQGAPAAAETAVAPSASRRPKKGS